MISSLFRILFPTQCFGCHKEGQAICGRCLSLTRKSLSVPQHYVVSVYDFKDPLIRKAIHAIKYHHRHQLIEPLTILLVERLRTIPNLANYILVPIPMNKLREALRGYNHAEKIAVHLSSTLTIPVDNTLLKRTRISKRQAITKTRTERLHNQIGSFCVTNSVQGANIILIDDVTTTGATFEEARTILLKQGAKSVYAASLAH